MAFKIEEVSETSHSVELQETLWLAADRETVVQDGDPAAAFLLGTAGKRLSREDAEKYGLVKGKGKPATKEAAPAEDKQAEPESDKAESEAPKKAAAKKATKDGA